MSDPLDDFAESAQPACEVCGTVMNDVDGDYRCRGCNSTIDVPWVEHPGDGDVLDGRWG